MGDLLAELRAISSKSTGDRFGSKEKVGETNYGKESESGYIDSSDEYKELLRSHSKSSDDTAFIHSKDNDKPISDAVCDSDNKLPANPTSEMGIGIQSDLPKTFKGDRGGLAEDADLLAE